MSGPIRKLMNRIDREKEKNIRDSLPSPGDRHLGTDVLSREPQIDQPIIGGSDQRHTSHPCQIRKIPYAALDSRRGSPNTRNNQNREWNRTPNFWNITQLHEFDLKDSAHILITLGHDYSRLHELLNAQRQDKESVRLTLSILAKACTCFSLPQNLNIILGTLHRSLFFTRQISNVILGISRADGKEAQRKTILNIICILRELFIRIPGPIANQSGVLILLRREIEILQETTEVIDEDIIANLEEVLDLERIKRKNLKADPQRILHKDSDGEGDAPNDYREMSLLPTLDDLNANIKPFLRKNKVKGRYDDVNHYLDVQFRLLREDFIQPLRDGIAKYQATLGDSTQRLQDIHVYNNVTFVRPNFTHTGILYRLRFDTSRLKLKNWTSSKRLIYGSLVCLSSDNFKTFYNATVSDSDRELIADGYIDLKFEHDIEEINSIDPDQRFIMVESTAFYEAYRHVLKGLQCLTALPFENHLVQCHNVVDAPEYIKRIPGARIDLRPLVDLKDKNNHSVSQVNVLDPESWPSHELLKLDESQYRALQTALTKEFSVIQGPPGTGKTYVGLKIVKALLHNSNDWIKEDINKKPILIVCYTNHALDQFLTGILQFHNEGVIRVGGRISDTNLEKYSLKTRKNEARCVGHYKDLGRISCTYAEDLDHLKQRTDDISSRIDTSENHVLSWNILCNVMSPRHKRQFEAITIVTKNNIMATLFAWLGIGLGNLCGLKSVKKSSQQNSEHKGGGVINVTGDYDIERNKRILHEDESTDEIYTHPKDTDSFNTFQEEAGFQLDRKQYNKLNRKLEQNIKSVTKLKAAEPESVKNVWSVDSTTRWKLYKYWVSQYRQQLRQDYLDYCTEYMDTVTSQREVVLLKEKLILAKASIIAMTTSGAARYHTILQEISPRITIVEEAAEVLEGHIITSLTEQCEHLILIGDHKQLRPNPNVYQLATKFNLDLSLFERMINNDVPCDGLDLQHRMRPEISKLMKHIYPNLKDHTSVYNRKHIKGMSKDVFFINHNHAEEHDTERRSHSNLYEVQFVIRLTEYLLKQGYGPECITILTTYTGQLLLFKQRMPKSQFEVIKVTSVDNYQGEENEIIILSLVRSNLEDNIGFLKIENRVCVALSRARNGLYVIGNFDMLGYKSSLWRDMVKTSKTSCEFGEVLLLRCQNHPGDPGIEVSTPEDFQKAPDGGCQKKCFARLDCGHACAMSCHPVDLEHKKYQCHKPCSETCVEGHPCQLKCFQKCLCPVPVEKTIPQCGHIEQVPCHMPPEDHDCLHPCQKVCVAGHPCNLKCFEVCKCSKLVAKVIPYCHHIEQVPCHLSPEDHACLHPCQKLCVAGHPCNLKCFEVCKCPKLVAKVMPGCHHTEQVPCYKKPSEHACQQPCVKILSCGHNCGNICSRSHECKTIEQKTLHCGHTGEVKCTDLERAICNAHCKKKLKCGHECQGTCNECMTQRLHKACSCTNNLANSPLSPAVCKRKCQHVPQKAKSDEFYNPCKKPCPWFCKHHQCGKGCSERCTLPPCEQPCEKTLGCGHICIGLCGEPCPRYCRICDAEVVTEIFFGPENSPDARFVMLIDCQHIFEYNILDKFMDSTTDFRCIICETPIKRSLRYGTTIGETELVLQRKQDFLKGLDNATTRVQTLPETSPSISTFLQEVLHNFNRLLNSCRTETEVVTLENQLELVVKAVVTHVHFLNITYNMDILTARLHDDIDVVKKHFYQFIKWLQLKRVVLSDQETDDAKHEFIRQSLAYQLIIFESKINAQKLSGTTKLDVYTCKSIITKGLPLTEQNIEYLKTTINNLKEMVPSADDCIIDVDLEM
ncbi:NFX1-type zinc finger-containing protein 1 [Patella vulgata]|uniref:NFX1-type zinc finger-containing protein 1 n=1 Tax=Patella vulgata TaxID=6465 RepID=UPI0024A81649|nr:NFX1-type zinc finger-containing protein 1 [Patella vulgata]